MTTDKVIAPQLKAESKEDFLKFRTFLDLGITRTLDAAYKMYYQTGYTAPPRWQVIADRFGWVARAAEYDKAVQNLSQPTPYR